MTSNILELSKDLLDPELQHELVETQTMNGTTYALIEQWGEIEAGLTLVAVEDGQARRLTADLLSDPEAGSIDPAIIQGFFQGEELLGQISQDIDLPDLPDPIMPLPGLDQILAVPRGGHLSQRDLLTAVHNLAIWGTTADGQVEMNSRLLAPAVTNRGRRACAWAVNRIVAFALGRPAGGGLATAEMVKVLRARDFPVSRTSAQPGAIIISPTTGNRIGHVGILGEGDLIYSNSTDLGNWTQSHTIAKWQNYYGGGKGLTVEFYHLNPARFAISPMPVA
ncbi:CHAP domain-containing protein [Paracoccus sulfuroxidans]|nr:CHAP domain-containing protein [Paracoccus sulfuroxidans]